MPNKFNIFTFIFLKIDMFRNKCRVHFQLMSTLDV